MDLERRADDLADKHDVDVASGRDIGTATGATLELLKQLIALSSGVLALSATFIEKLQTNVPWLLVLLGLSWLSLIGGVFLGLQAMSAFVKSLTLPHFHWTRKALRKYAKASNICFIAGISLFASFAFFSLIFSSNREPRSNRASQAISIPVVDTRSSVSDPPSAKPVSGTPPGPDPKMRRDSSK